MIIRDISKNTKKAKEYYNNLFLFRIIISLLFILVVFIFALFQKSSTIDLIIIYAIGMGFFLLGNFNLSFLISFQENKYQAISDAIQKVTYTLGVILVIVLNYKLFGIIVANAVASVVVFVFSFFAIKKFIKIKNLKLNKKYIKQKLILASPFIFTCIFWTIYFNIDRIFITYIRGNYATGLYSISNTFLGFLLSFIGILSTTFFPVLSNVSNNKLKLKSIVDKYLLLIYLFSAPATIGCIYLAPQIITLVFGSQYLGGTIAFQLVMLFFLLNSVGLVNYYLLITNNLEKYSLKILGVSTGTNLLLNFIFVPWLGIVGAAITTIIAEVVIFILSYKKIRSDIIKIDYFSPLIKPAIASGIMLLGLIFYNYFYPIGVLHNKFDVLISIAIGVIIYISTLFITKTITLKQIKETIKI